MLFLLQNKYKKFIFNFKVFIQCVFTVDILYLPDAMRFYSRQSNFTPVTNDLAVILQFCVFSVLFCIYYFLSTHILWKIQWPVQKIMLTFLQSYVGIGNYPFIQGYSIFLFLHKCCTVFNYCFLILSNLHNIIVEIQISRSLIFFFIDLF